MQDSYESMKLLLGKIKYDEFKWKLCGDLKVVALLLGMQFGYTKYCCFLCEWDSRDKKYHFVNKLWSKRTSLTSGEKKVVNPPFVLSEKFFRPHEKICENMEKTGCGFQYVRYKLPNVSDTKIKEGTFIGHQIRELMEDKEFIEDLNDSERNAWLSFKRICKDFLGNHKAANYREVV